MATENERAVLAAIEFDAEDVELDSFEQLLEDKLQGEFEDLEFLQSEREHINNPDHLGETVLNVVMLGKISSEKIVVSLLICVAKLRSKL